MRMLVEAPFFPTTFDTEIDLVLGDESLRQKPGIWVTLSWPTRSKEERGTKLFLCEACLLGIEQKAWHDKRCLFYIKKEVK